VSAASALASSAATSHSSGASSGTSSGEIPGARDRLLFAPGEYSPYQDWHGIYRFEDALGSVTVPDGFVNVQETTDASSVALNFVHTLFLDTNTDNLYVGALFTPPAGHTADECHGSANVGFALACGSIGVFGGASGLDGVGDGNSQVLTRHIYGPATQLNQPHGVWMDRQRDILYVANTMAGNILVFEEASAADGDVAPDRVIEFMGLGSPVHVYLDDPADRLFVVSMGATGTAPEASRGAAVFVFNAASTLNGASVQPNLRIAGAATRLGSGNNFTTHNVWFRPNYDAQNNHHIYVGHHTNEILVFSVSEAELMSAPTTDISPEPKVLRVNENADNSDENNWSAYGLFYVPGADRLYVAVGATPGNGGSTGTGGPTPGSPPNVIKVYNELTASLETLTAGSNTGPLIPPAHIVSWDGGDQFYPAQPMWVTQVR
jgi:hypothetical protein